MREIALHVRVRLRLASDGNSTPDESVFCPARGCSVDTDSCKTCVHVRSVSARSVVCAPEERLGVDTEPVAASAALGRVTIVREDVPTEILLALSNGPPWLVPIVDGSDRFLGFVSATRLAKSRSSGRGASATLAGEIAVGASMLALESAPLAHALRVMARRGARSLALVDRSGVVRGVLSDVDALRALTLWTSGAASPWIRS